MGRKTEELAAKGLTLRGYKNAGRRGQRAEIETTHWKLDLNGRRAYPWPYSREDRQMQRIDQMVSVRSVARRPALSNNPQPQPPQPWTRIHRLGGDR